MQQVIIYRNPAEVMVWEFIMSSPNFFSLIVAVLSAIVVFVSHTSCTSWLGKFGLRHHTEILWVE